MMQIEIRKIVAVNMVTGEAKATINSLVDGTPRLLKRLTSTICFELAGQQYWATPASWRGRSQGYIEVN
jgi:hypothetical protein